MIRYLLITILLALNCSLLGQNKINTQTDFSKDLKIHQLETDAKLKEIERVEAVSVSEIKRVDNRIDDLRDHTTNYLTILGVIVAIASIIVAILIAKQDKKAKENQNLINHEGNEIKKIKAEIYNLKIQAENALKEIKDKAIVINNLYNKIVNQTSNTNYDSTSNEKDIELTEEARYTAEYIIRNIPPARYTFKEWFILGYDAQENKQYEDASYYYSKSNELEEDFVTLNNWGNALSNLATIEKDKKLFKDAIKKYEKAIELKTDYPDAYNNLGNALLGLARINNDEQLFKDAIEKYEKAIELKTDFPEAYNNLASARTSHAKLNGDLQEQKEEIESKLILANNITEGYGSYNLACLYSLLNDKETAFKWMEHSLEHDNKNTRNQFETDFDFENIRTDKRFKELLDKYRPE